MFPRLYASITRKTWAIWRIDNNGHTIKALGEPVLPVAFFLHGAEDAMNRWTGRT
ncbi:hypothetical protein AOG1_18200 [Geobacter sp. AOG1]|nr:hypothetical protein AOG1_18200 [Geobacter sp. AOG1]